MLNRSVLIVRPKQPYLDWAPGLDDSGLLPDADGEKTIYLLPDFENDEEGWEYVKEFHAEVFERELDGWHTDESAWPPNRDFTMFQEWFDIEIHSAVEDLVEAKLIDDED